jgi:hypothetical protein
MDGLSMLFGVLIAVFLLVVLSINFFNTRPAKEGFDSPDMQTSPSQTTIETQIRTVLDPLAFYNSPDGTSFGSGKTDGEQLCTLFTQVREALAKNEGAGQSLSDAEVAKRVEESLRMKIPGGALPCPLLQYPAQGSTDLEWLSFLQSVPEDFGARVVLMVQYVEAELTTTASNLKNALNGEIQIPTLKESFINVCPPTLANKKRDDRKEAACSLPEDLSPEQIQEAVTLLLQSLVAKKNTILKANLKDILVPKKSVHQSIIDAKVAADYLKKQEESMKAGTLAISAPIAALS